MGLFSLGAIQTMKADEMRLGQIFNHQVSESTTGRYRSSEYKHAHNGEPDEAILGSLEDQISPEKDKNSNMPKQLPALEQSPHNFDLLRPDGRDTPKFNEESLDEENIYVRKRLMLQERKEFYAQENYRSETTPHLH